MRLRRIGNRLRRFHQTGSAGLTVTAPRSGQCLVRALPDPGKPLSHGLCCSAAARYSRAFGPTFARKTGFAGFIVPAPVSAA